MLGLPASVYAEDTSVEWDKLECRPTIKLVCLAKDCTKTAPTVWVILDKRGGVVSRCDEKGCDTYKSQFSESGAFTNIQPEIPRGFFIKAFGTSTYLEVTTLAFELHISSGYCREQ